MVSKDRLAKSSNLLSTVAGRSQARAIYGSVKLLRKIWTLIQKS